MAMKYENLHTITTHKALNIIITLFDKNVTSEFDASVDCVSTSDLIVVCAFFYRLRNRKKRDQFILILCLNSEQNKKKYVC